MSENAGDLLRVQVPTVLDTAGEKLKEAILLGHLLPGQRLVEGEIARRMGISRPSLREVLRRLEAQQLIALVPNRGSFVATLTPPDIEEIREVWRLLTGEAVHRFAGHVDDGSIAEMDACLSQAAAAAEDGDRLRLVNSTNAFFRVILVGAGNTTLANLIRGMVLRINFLRAEAMQDTERRRRHVAELRTVRDALDKRDARAARRAVHAHVDAACAGALAVSTRRDAA